MKISRELIEEMVAHAREVAPEECCGVVEGSGEQAVAVHRITNAEASPLRYRMEPQEQYNAIKRIEDNGNELLAIYHSHTRSAAYPSQTDVNEAVMWPDQVYLIVSLESPDDPDVKGFFLRDGAISEAELTVA